MDKTLFNQIAFLIDTYSTDACVVDSQSWYEYCIIRNGQLCMTPARALLIRFLSKSVGNSNVYVQRLISDFDLQRGVNTLRKKDPEAKKRILNHKLNGVDVETIIKAASHGLIIIKLDKYK